MALQGAQLAALEDAGHRLADDEDAQRGEAAVRREHGLERRAAHRRRRRHPPPRRRVALVAARRSRWLAAETRRAPARRARAAAAAAARQPLSTVPSPGGRGMSSATAALFEHRHIVGARLGPRDTAPATAGRRRPAARARREIDRAPARRRKRRRRRAGSRANTPPRPPPPPSPPPPPAPPPTRRRRRRRRLGARRGSCAPDGPRAARRARRRRAAAPREPRDWWRLELGIGTHPLQQRGGVWRAGVVPVAHARPRAARSLVGRARRRIHSPVERRCRQQDVARGCRRSCAEPMWSRARRQRRRGVGDGHDGAAPARPCARHSASVRGERYASSRSARASSATCGPLSARRRAKRRGLAAARGVAAQSGSSPTTAGARGRRRTRR